jgi:uncharacterized hydrophobic protein (TIGR00271 family)
MAVAGVLAAVGLLTNSVPVLIGAMVVAPAFAPLMAFSFGLVGGQVRLGLRGLGTAVLGLAVAVGFATLTTWLLNVSGILTADQNLLQRPLLEERVRPGWYSVVVAAAAGIAGVIAVMQRKKDTLVGIVSSVALVPAGGAAGIALLSGDSTRAFGGLVLLAINVGLIVAMAILVLLVVGKREVR